MKQISFIRPLLTFAVLALLISCEKDKKYTIEDKLVTGTFSYTQSGFVPIEVDTLTQQPLKAKISFAGTGNLSDIGKLTFESSFTFDFVSGQGIDFETTYSGEDPGDSFISLNGSSQMTGNMIFVVTESIGEGKGKFDKIKGSGETLVTLTSDGSSGTGDVSWTVTY